MPTMRVRFSSLFWSLLRIACFTVALCFGRGLAVQTKPPQTPEQTEARDALDQGVQAYKNGQYDEAARLFEHAKQLDPQLVNARLYLATAYASQYIPGAPSEENRQRGERGIAEYKALLEMDPQNLGAIDGLGSLLFQLAATMPSGLDGFQASKMYHLQHIEIKPDDPEPYYWVGVIDWTIAYRANGGLRQAYNSGHSRGLAPAAPLPADLRDEYQRNYEPTIDEGIENLKHAITLRPDYDDALAYLNLLYRQKADTVANTSERKQFLKTADELVDRVKEIKQQRAQAQPQQP